MCSYTAHTTFSLPPWTVLAVHCTPLKWVSISLLQTETWLPRTRSDRVVSKNQVFQVPPNQRWKLTFPTVFNAHSGDSHTNCFWESVLGYSLSRMAFSLRALLLPLRTRKGVQIRFWSALDSKSQESPWRLVATDSTLPPEPWFSAGKRHRSICILTNP